ncbi:MAG: DNA repair protein RadC [Oscillospiraceae bacterium]|nr:DNA repair protein RadC [Oscillospiraceae bacterium]MBQ6428312.1 DNA repair protein RadC [Oscillospiraceae bacterium]
MDDQLRGHRNRVRERYLNTGLDAFRDYEALELLLFYAIPRKDTKSTAKNLISRFGSLPAVLDATSAELTEAGLSPNAAILLKLVPDMNRYYAVKTDGAGQKVHSTSDAGRILCAMFRHEQTESVRLLCLNAGGKVLKLALLNEGDINAVHFSVRKIVETALSAKAVSVILAHNHPGGTLTPSREDLDATNSAKAALSTVGIQLLDHLIISGDGYCSLREEGYL